MPTPYSLQVSPDDFNEKLGKARQFMQLQNYSEALGWYAKLVKQYPRGGPWGEYGRAATIAGDFDLAVKIWEKLRDFEPDTTELLSQLAWEYQNIRLHAKARELYAAAAKLEPRNLDAQLTLASVLAKTGSVEDARIALEKCVTIDPRNEQVRYLSAHLDRRENKLEAAEGQFQDLLATGVRDAHINYSCHSELANIFDRREQFEEAMTQLAKAKSVAAQSADSGAERKVEEWHENAIRKAKALPKNILAIWGKSFPPSSREKATSIAFLSGSARSGTTLLERILDAHPQVAACDEALAFETILPQVDVAAPVIPSQKLNLLRQRYVKNVARVLGPIEKGKMILDKNPSRTDWLPAFLRTFPELRVLIALRDPRDVMISLYFQNQTKTNHLTFERLGSYYRHVMDMWLVVREWEGLNWLQTRYEDIVADLTKEGSRVTQFLGLEWHENQARFYDSNREKPVMSTNYTDVTKPVYKRSVGRWQAYEKHLAPVLPLLEPYCKEFGYV